MTSSPKFYLRLLFTSGCSKLLFSPFEPSCLRILIGECHVTTVTAFPLWPLIRALYFALILKLNFDDVSLYLYFTFSHDVFRDAFNKVHS
jgi:hypothetical protein